MEIYESQEDSYLLEKEVKKHAKGFVLDMGTGSGIQALAALKKAKSVLAVDVNGKAIENLKKKKIKKLEIKRSNLFSDVTGEFDTIIFNPPYLPYEKKEPKDIKAYTTGGKKGYELIERFLSQASGYLKADGIILIVFSSITKREKIDEIIERFGFEANLLSSKKIAFEELYIYLIKKSNFLKNLEKLKIENIEKITKGHRGLIYTGLLNNKKVAIKKERTDIAAVGRIKNEVKFLKLLNNIGPKVILSRDNFFVYYWIEGDFILDFIEKNKKIKIKEVLKNIFNQMYQLDKLGINKEEMHHPYKHVVIGKKVMLLDFERANYTKKPKNVTQFCQCICSMKRVLEKKGFKINIEKIRALAKEYKNKRKNIKKILDELI